MSVWSAWPHRRAQFISSEQTNLKQHENFNLPLKTNRGPTSRHREVCRPPVNLYWAATEGEIKRKAPLISSNRWVWSHEAAGPQMTSWWDCESRLDWLVTRTGSLAVQQSHRGEKSTWSWLTLQLLAETLWCKFAVMCCDAYISICFLIGSNESD